MGVEFGDNMYGRFFSYREVLIMRYFRHFFAVTTLISLYASSATATPISVALDALKFVVKNQTSIATTFAVAHTAAGTGAAL